MTKARTLADNYAADINQVTASAPLTGGGTSGTVTVGIQDGTTSQKGAVQLEDSTASTSTTKASTPNSVKSAYDLANGAIAKSTVDAKGDLLVGTANDTISRLAVASTAGYVLTVDSAEATGLKWAAAAGGGKVLQVVYATTTSGVTIASTTFTDTNLTATITPTSASSTILIFVNQVTDIYRSSTAQGGEIRILRGSTSVFEPGVNTGYETNYLALGNATDMQLKNLMCLVYRDSPATTSSTTYKTQGRCYLTSNSGSIKFQQGSSISSMLLMEIGA